MFRDRYKDAMSEPRWDSIPSEPSPLYPWQEDSTYIRLPTFFQGLGPEAPPIAPIDGARVLLKLGDSITTDHISPAGAILKSGPAGRWLQEQGVEKGDFNSFGSRRGNHEVMMRGTFANVRIRNELAPGTEGGWSIDHATGEVMSVYEAAQNADGPMVVLAGAQYGTGSSETGPRRAPTSWREGGDGHVLRAHPPVQPGWHGRPPADLRGRSDPRFARFGRHGTLLHPHHR